MSFSGDVFEPMLNSNAKQRAALVEWLDSLLPNLNFPRNASDEEIRLFLIDGTVLCQILNKLQPGSVSEHGGSVQSESGSGNVKRFLSAVKKIGLPRFPLSDLEKGSMKIVLEWLFTLFTLRTQFIPNVVGYSFPDTLDNQFGSDASTRMKVLGESLGYGDNIQKDESPRGNLSFQRALRSPLLAEPPAALIQHVGQKFHEVFQLKQGGNYTDLPAAKISEMMKSNSLDNAPTQSLLSVINGILDESIERKNEEIPHRVACLLRKVVQEIERRISTQAEHLRTQNNLFKAREEKYQSRIRVLEALASGTNEETQIVRNQLHKVQSEKIHCHEKIKVEEQHSASLMKEKDDHNQEIAALKQGHNCEIAGLKQDHSREIAALKQDHRCEIAALKKDPKQDIEALKQDHSREIKALKEDHKQEIAALKQDHRCEIVALKEDPKQDIEALKQDHSRETAALKQEHHHEISTLKQELETVMKNYKQQHLEMNTVSRGAQQELEERLKETLILLTESRNKVKELESSSELKVREIEERLKETLILLTESRNKVKDLESSSESKVQELEERLKETLILLTESRNKVKELESSSESNVQELEERLKETLILLTDSRNKVKELESSSESKEQLWSKKENVYQKFTGVQLGALHDLRFVYQSMKQEITKTQNSYLEDFNQLGLGIRSLGYAAANYYSMLAENQKLHNELQELKGNIRVYCRIRPFLLGQKEKQSTIEYVGENGELVVANPSKQGKESRRSFKFNKVYGQASKQAEVFSDIRPLIQSVLDGYNVCIFAYGQTGSGKTYTMTGPDRGSEEEWGVNYRALNNLFKTSQSRESAYFYDITVQMVEIYNEQVRDLLSSDSSQKRLGILSTSQPNGIAVPDATMYPVKETSDVLHLMDVGLKNRAKGSTALNERSSRSHSIVTIHIRGIDHRTGSSTQSSLHLVDLAGSERVDRSEVTGDRLKEAQHINKSLSALGDVISALAQKTSHVPYRNSKLTQVLQSSLGGQAKTLMFVQLNPDASSHSETMSTLKFAERVSGVELGAARSNKDGRDVRELMEQVALLRDTIGKKDEEIESLQVQKDIKNGSQGVNNEKHGTGSLRDADNEERLTDISDTGLSVGTETDGSAEGNDGENRSDNAQKPRMVPRISRTPERSSPKSLTGLRKSASGSNLGPKTPSRKWH